MAIDREFEGIDAYSLADGARRRSVGAVIAQLRPQTGATAFIGRALTARIHYEPNRHIPVKDYGSAAIVDRAGPGDVVVIDGGGLPLTTLGDMAAASLQRRGAAAVVVNANVRDVESMVQDLPVFAIDVGITSFAGHAYVTGIGEPVTVGGVRIATGDLMAGCRGGVVVVPWDERAAVLEETRAIIAADRIRLEGILRGESHAAMWARTKSNDQ